jgi:hypothetical protein
LNGSQLTSNGPVVDLVGGAFTPGGAVARLTNGSTLTTTGPFVRASAGSSLFADVLVATDGARNRLDLRGGLLDLSGAVVSLSALTRTSCDCSVTDSLVWTLGVNEPIIRLANSLLVVGEPRSLVTRGVDFVEPAAQPGVSLIATGSAGRTGGVRAFGPLLQLGPVTLTDPDPQLQLTDSAAEVIGHGGGISIMTTGQPATAAGPLLQAIRSTLFIERDSLLDLAGRLTVNGPGPGALLQFTDSDVRTGTEIVLVRPGGALTLDRGLVDAVGTKFETNTFDTFFTVALGGAVAASTSSPLIRLDSSSVTMQANEDLIHVGSGFFGGGNRASLSLTGGGPLVRLESMSFDFGLGSLLRVTGSDVSTTGPLLETLNADVSFDGPIVRLAAGSTLTTTGAPVVRVAGGSVRADALLATDGAANVTRVTGGFLDLSNNANVTLGRITQAAEGIVTTRAVNEPLIRMSSSALSIAADPAIGLRSGFGPGVVLSATGTDAAPSTLTVRGEFLNLGDVTLTDPNAQLQLTGTRVAQNTNGESSFVEMFGSGSGATLSGPLMTANSSTLNVDVLLNVESGTLRTSGSGTGALLQFANSTVATRAEGIFVTSSLQLDRPLLTAIETTMTTAGDLLHVSDGGQVITQAREVPYALISLVGGKLTAGGEGSLLNLLGPSIPIEPSGGGFVPDPQPDPVTNEPSGLRFGDVQPLQHGGGGALVETFKGANVTVTGSVARVVDAQLLAATVPALLNLSGGSTLSTGSHALDLVRNAKVELTDVVRLSNSTLNVGSAANPAHLANVNASRLNVGGDLVKMMGGSTINLFGALLNVMNGGVASIGGALVNFTGTNNTINVTNSLRPTSFINGIPVYVGADARANLRFTGTPLAGMDGTTNRIVINNSVLPPNATGGVTGSLISVQGTGGTVKIGAAR